MDLDNGQRSIEAWYFIFSICFFNASRSMFCRALGSMAAKIYPHTTPAKIRNVRESVRECCDAAKRRERAAIKAAQLSPALFHSWTVCCVLIWPIPAKGVEVAGSWTGWLSGGIEQVHAPCIPKKQFPVPVSGPIERRLRRACITNQYREKVGELERREWC